MTRKHRARRHGMAVAHARRKDNRRYAETGIKASDRRAAIKVLNRIVRRVLSVVV